MAMRRQPGTSVLDICIRYNWATMASFVLELEEQSIGQELGSDRQSYPRRRLCGDMRIAAAILGTILSCVGLDARDHAGMMAWNVGKGRDHGHITEFFALFRGQKG
jgi:hypothetical protein